MISPVLLQTKASTPYSPGCQAPSDRRCDGSCISNHNGVCCERTCMKQAYHPVVTQSHCQRMPESQNRGRWSFTIEIVETQLFIHHMGTSTMNDLRLERIVHYAFPLVRVKHVDLHNSFYFQEMRSSDWDRLWSTERHFSRSWWIRSEASGSAALLLLYSLHCRSRCQQSFTWRVPRTLW